MCVIVLILATLMFWRQTVSDLFKCLPATCLSVFPQIYRSTIFVFHTTPRTFWLFWSVLFYLNKKKNTSKKLTQNDNPTCHLCKRLRRRLLWFETENTMRKGPREDLKFGDLEEGFRKFFYTLFTATRPMCVDVGRLRVENSSAEIKPIVSRDFYGSLKKF